ncbi:MAG: hypothetical protein LUK37_03630 [Clostridia bacterium]|nr:hypothetical protein [Clostridia bacterium]
MYNKVKVSERIGEFVAVPKTAIPAVVAHAVATHLDHKCWSDDLVLCTSTPEGIIVITYKVAFDDCTFEETYVQSKEEAIHGSSDYLDYEKWFEETLRNLSEGDEGEGEGVMLDNCEEYDCFDSELSNAIEGLFRKE